MTDDSRIETRAELLPEEATVGSDDPHAQAEEILADSDFRTEHPDEAAAQSDQLPPGGGRVSADATDGPVGER